MLLEHLEQGGELQKFYQRSYIVNLSDLCNAIKKYWTKYCVMGTLRLMFTYAIFHAISTVFFFLLMEPDRNVQGRNRTLRTFVLNRFIHLYI